MAVNNNQLNDHENDETSCPVSRGRHNVTIINSSLSSSNTTVNEERVKVNGSSNSKCYDRILPVNNDKRSGKTSETEETEDNEAQGEEDDDTFPDMLRVKSEEYSARIAKLQEEYLIPLKEDLAEWINRITDSTAAITADNFMHKLDNGVIICKLAKLIESQVTLHSPTATVTPVAAGTATNITQCLPLVNTIQSSQSSEVTTNCTVISDLPAVDGVTIDQVNLMSQQRRVKSNDKQDDESCLMKPLDISSSPSCKSHSSSSNESVAQVDAIGSEEERVKERSSGDCSPSLPPTPKPRGVNHLQQMSSLSSVSSTSSSRGAAGDFSPVNGTLVAHNSDTLPQLCLSSDLSSSSLSSPGRFISPSQSIKPVKQMPSNCSSKPLLPSNIFKIASVKCWQGAKSHSFHARDNVSNFIKWCRYLGVREAVIFETEDLVSHNNQRNVVLCLLEVARIICTKYGYTIVPGLVEFEKEIDRQIEREEREIRLTQSLPLHRVDNESTTVVKCGEQEKQVITSEPVDQLKANISNADTIDSPHHCSPVKLNVVSDDDEKTVCNEAKDIIDEILGVTVTSPSPSASLISLTSTAGEDESNVCSPIPCESLTNQSIDSYEVNTSNTAASQLDQKVMLIAKSFYGKKAKQGIQRLEEGKYRIAGKIVFVRLLRDRHVMIRIGGGWDTLQHFLERHGLEEETPEISVSDLLPMDTRPGETKRRSTSLRRSLSSSQSTMLNSSFNLSGEPVQGQISLVTPQQQQQQQCASKSINLPGGTALLTVVPKSPSSVATTNGFSLLRSPSTSLLSRRCMNSTPVSRRSSISSPEPWNNCASGASSGIGSTTSSSNGEPSSPSTVGGHSSISSSRASNHSTTNTFNYSPEVRKQNIPKSLMLNRRSSISGAITPSHYSNSPSRIPGMNDITRTSSFTNSLQQQQKQNGKFSKRRSLDSGSNRNLMNRSFIALNTGNLSQQCSPSLSSSTRSLIPTPICNKSRYINYLTSSQHITNGSSNNINGVGVNSNKATCVKDLINGNSVLTNTNSFNEANNLLSSMPKRTTVN